MLINYKEVMKDEILDLEEEESFIPAYYCFIGIMRLLLLLFVLYRLATTLRYRPAIEDMTTQEIMSGILVVIAYGGFIIYNLMQGIKEVQRSPNIFTRIRFRAFSVVISIILCSGLLYSTYPYFDDLQNPTVIQNIALTIILGILVLFDVRYARRSA